MFSLWAFSRQRQSRHLPLAADSWEQRHSCGSADCSACARALESEGCSCSWGWSQTCRAALPRKRRRMTPSSSGNHHPSVGAWTRSNHVRMPTSAPFVPLLSNCRARATSAPHPWIWLSLMFVVSRSLELAQFTLLLIHRLFEDITIQTEVWAAWAHLYQVLNKHVNHQGVFCHTSFPALTE